MTIGTNVAPDRRGTPGWVRPAGVFVAAIAWWLVHGGDVLAAPKVDQSAFALLEQSDALAGRNAQTVSRQMEWE